MWNSHPRLSRSEDGIRAICGVRRTAVAAWHDHDDRPEPSPTQTRCVTYAGPSEAIAVNPDQAVQQIVYRGRLARARQVSRQIGRHRARGQPKAWNPQLQPKLKPGRRAAHRDVFTAVPRSCCERTRSERRVVVDTGTGRRTCHSPANGFGRPVAHGGPVARQKRPAARRYIATSLIAAARYVKGVPIPTGSRRDG
jgi:hypothetical protein